MPDPERPDGLVGMREGEIVSRLRMREAGGVEVQSDSERLCPVDPAGEVFGTDRVTVHAPCAELSVERVQVEAVPARNEGQGLRGVAAELVGSARLARIIAGRRKARTQLAVRLLESRDIVSLPAVEGDRDRREPPEGRIGVDALVGVALSGEAVRGFGGMSRHITFCCIGINTILCVLCNLCVLCVSFRNRIDRCCSD